MDAHELIAAYALDALDETERAAFEEHLRGCEQCREELPRLTEAASALAFAAAAPPPPAGLRGRILDAVAPPAAVVPLRPWRTIAVAASGVAAVAAAVAIALGVWGWSVSDRLETERAATRILTHPDARAVSLDGAAGRLVVTPAGDAALVVSLERAPAGSTYEAWVIRDGEPQPAGLFDGDAEQDVVVLDRPVRDDATVAVTLEREGGVDAPTNPILFSADSA
jgi:anti-sigma-K factor RskA